MIIPARSGRERDGGFTLVEMLVVVAVLGLVITSLAMVFITVLRVTPANESRDDDARTLLGLTTYLPEDVNSTPPGGYDYAKSTPTGCFGTSPGINLVRLTWTEDTGTTQTFHASYRYVDDGEGYRIMRYACETGQTPTSNAMSSVLPPIDEATWTPGDEPVRVIAEQEAGVDVGLAFAVTTVAGDRIYLEMFSNNPSETLPPVPPGYYPIVPIGNNPPVAADVNTTTTLGTAFAVSIPASDPDLDGITITMDNVPSGWTTVVSGTVVTVTPPVTAVVGDTAVIEYTAADPFGQTATAFINVEIVPISTNQPPAAADLVTSIDAGVLTTLNLPATDPDGDPLTLTLGSVHPSLTVNITGETQITVLSDGTQNTPPTITYTVSDGTASTSARIDLTVETCNVTGLTSSDSSVARRSSGKLDHSITYDVTYTGPCLNLVLEYDPTNDGNNEAYLSFGSGTQVTLAGHPGGQNNWVTGNHTLILRDSQTGPSLATIPLTVT